MQIELSKEQYKSFLRAVDVASFVYGIMSDAVDEKYKKQSDEIDDLTNQVLKYADEFGQTEFVEKFQGKNVLSDDYSNKILDDMTEFEEYTFWDNLARKLAIKEMSAKYSSKERKNMEQMDYLKEVWELEEKYHQIFEDEGIDNFEFRK